MLTCSGEEPIKDCECDRAGDSGQPEHTEHETPANEHAWYDEIVHPELGHEDGGYHPSNCASKVHNNKL